MVTTAQRTYPTTSTSQRVDEMLQDRIDLAHGILAARDQWITPLWDLRLILASTHYLPSSAYLRGHIPASSGPAYRCPATHYTVTPQSCTCPDAERGIAARLLGGWCKHRIALWLLTTGYR